MSFISPVMSARFETHNSIRQRRISESSNRIATGNRLSSDPSHDSAAYRISKRLEIESKFSNSAKKNFENAYTLAQQQSDIVSYAENVIKQMNKLAYDATDPTSSDHEREILNHEFQEHSKTLESLMFDRSFDRQLLDPQAAEYIDRTIVYPDEQTSSGVYSKKIDISALGAKVMLWWNSYDSRDRIQLKQGDNWFFDSGEYLSDTGSGVRSETVNGQTVVGDYFEIDIQPNQVSYTNAPEIVVNEPGPERIARSGGTDWSWSVSISPEQIDGTKGIADEKGTLYELSPIGFSTLKGYDISSRISASNSLARSELELESLRKQIYKLAKTFSEIRLKSDYIGQKNVAQQTALSRISDSDLASEYTSLAKNLLLQKASNHALVHSRISAENIINLIS